MSDMQWMQPIIISSFSVHLPDISDLFCCTHLFQFLLLFSAQCSHVHLICPSFLISYFFSAQCPHITADISLCGPRRRSPHHRLWFWLSGKTLTVPIWHLAHDYVIWVGWKLYFKVSTKNLFSTIDCDFDNPVKHWHPSWWSFTLRMNVVSNAAKIEVSFILNTHYYNNIWIYFFVSTFSKSVPSRDTMNSLAILVLSIEHQEFGMIYIWS